MQSFDSQPTSPPPDPNKPYVWFAGQWLLVARDADDGVPDELDLSEDEQGLPFDPWAHLR